MPDLKTIAEQGVPGYDYVNRTGFVAPARTPEAIVNRLSAEFAKVAKTPEIVQKMEGDGAEMVGSTPEQFRQSLVTDAARWRKIVQENGIKPPAATQIPPPVATPNSSTLSRCRRT
jgi:tripartite-type tricarboxylate transporter receptor subunit TctC